jgi:hypothetical protein
MSIMALCREFGCLAKDRWPSKERQVDIKMGGKVVSAKLQTAALNFESRHLFF